MLSSKRIRSDKEESLYNQWSIENQKGTMTLSSEYKSSMYPTTKQCMYDWRTILEWKYQKELLPQALKKIGNRVGNGSYTGRKEVAHKSILWQFWGYIIIMVKGMSLPSVNIVWRHTLRDGKLYWYFNRFVLPSFNAEISWKTQTK